MAAGRQLVGPEHLALSSLGIHDVESASICGGTRRHRLLDAFGDPFGEVTHRTVRLLLFANGFEHKLAFAQLLLVASAVAQLLGRLLLLLVFPLQRCNAGARVVMSEESGERAAVVAREGARGVGRRACGMIGSWPDPSVLGLFFYRRVGKKSKSWGGKRSNFCSSQIG